MGGSSKKKRRSKSQEPKSSTSAIRELEELICNDDTCIDNINGLTQLLSYLSESETVRLQALHALRRCFDKIRDLGHLEQDVDKTSSHVSPEVVTFRKWIYSQFSEFICSLEEWIAGKEENQTFVVGALRTLLHFARGNEDAVDEDLILVALRAVVSRQDPNGANSQVIKVLIEEYLGVYVDVCYYIMRGIKTICEYRSSSSSETSELSKFGIDERRKCREIEVPHFYDSTFNILYAIPISDTDADKLNDSKNWWVPLTKDAKGYKKLKSKRAHRSAFQKAWIAFLNCKPLPQQIYRKALVCLPKRVIPNMENPLLLSDFLAEAYDIGGSSSLLALNSLFMLIIEHGLDYPDFYGKLYKLLDFDMFHTKHRAQFFELLDTVLSSTHLASYLVAAFAKKISRLALNAPPSGAMYAVVFVSNLLKKHPACITLVHQPTKQELNGDEKEEEKKAKLQSIKEASLQLALGSKRKRAESATSAVSTLQDVFLEGETDPAKCRANESCLWEIETLSRHYCPNVSVLVQNLFYTELKASLQSKVIQPPAPLKDFIDITYKSLFDRELRAKKQKKIPLNFVNHYETLEKAESKQQQSAFSLFHLE